MKSVVLRDGEIHVEEQPKPVPGEGQVLVKSKACGICGSDLHLLKHGNQTIELDKKLGFVKEDEEVDPNVYLGHEYVAEIIEFGPNTQQNLSVGDRVC